jgi:hypothetical protein
MEMKEAPTARRRTIARKMVVMLNTYDSPPTFHSCDERHRNGVELTNCGLTVRYAGGKENYMAWVLETDAVKFGHRCERCEWK